MHRFLKVYKFALLGALGGVLASKVHQGLFVDVLSGTLSTTTRFGYLCLLGFTVGGVLGAFLSYIEGVRQVSALRAVRFAGIGGALGAVGGLVALPVAEASHVLLGGGVAGRSLSLALLGGAIGAAEGINGGARWSRGVVGGAIGGALAGAAIESLLSHESLRSQSGILALLVIGLSIALMTALFVNLLADAWLEGLEGSKVHGQVYHLSKFRDPHQAVIGCDKKGEVFIHVADSEPQHAGITLARGGARLRHLAEEGATLVNGNSVVEATLSDGCVIDIGGARFRYRERSSPGGLHGPSSMEAS